MPKQNLPQSTEQGNDRYQAFIQNSSEGIWRFELDEPLPTTLSIKKQIAHCYKHACLAEANTAMAQMYGYRTPKPLIGMRLNEMMVETDPANTAYLEAFVKSGYKLSGVESHEIDKAGKDKYFRNSLVGIIENNHVVRAWGTQQDVTEEHAAKEALQRSEERLSLALQSSSMGIWEWNVETGELYWSPELKSIYGLKPNDSVSYERYLKLVHPQHRKSVQAYIQTAMKTGRAYHFEHKILWEDGSEHWILSGGKAYIDSGKPVRMTGTATIIDQLKQATELKKINHELQTQRKQLIALNKAKDDFVALASHQLRTPATAVKQYISLLINEYAGPVTADQLQYLQIAYNSNERQLNIINALLKTAQIDSRGYELDKKKYDISKLIEAVVDDLEVSFDLKRQTIKLHNIVPVVVSIDKTEMQLAIMNLLENASKYSYPNTEIKISMRRTDKFVEVAIKDKGVGISEENKQRIFDKFTRIDNDLSDTVSGSGLGLYWVKRIVKLHGGSIKVNSRLGKGATFIIRLPV